MGDVHATAMDYLVQNRSNYAIKAVKPKENKPAIYSLVRIFEGR